MLLKKENLPKSVGFPTPIPTQVVSLTSVPDETADWKIYTDTEYGYSFKYPQNWNYRKDPNFLPNTVFFSPEPIEFVPNSEGPVTPMQITIIKGTDIDKEVASYKNSYQFIDLKEENIIINGASSKKISGVVGAESYVTGLFNSISFFPKGKNIVVVSFIELLEIKRNLFDQILSTLKFLD